MLQSFVYSLVAIVSFPGEPDDEYVVDYNLSRSDCIAMAAAKTTPQAFNAGMKFTCRRTGKSG